MDIDGFTDDGSMDASAGDSALSAVDTSQLASVASALMVNAANTAISSAGNAISNIGAPQYVAVPAPSSSFSLGSMSTAEKLMIAVALGALVLAVVHK
jgi:hypothetical protein